VHQPDVDAPRSQFLDNSGERDTVLETVSERGMRTSSNKFSTEQQRGKQ